MNSFKVIKAYLAKKAQETIPDSPERREALEALQYSPHLALHYLSKGLITEEEARHFALEHIKNHTTDVRGYLRRKLITKEEAFPLISEHLKAYPKYVIDYFIEGFITKENALPFALEVLKLNPHVTKEYVNEGLITKRQAYPFISTHINARPHYLMDYLTDKLITEKQARAFALRHLKKEQHAPALSYFVNGLITREEALPFALIDLEEKPYRVELYVTAELLTKEEARPFALKVLGKSIYYDLAKYVELGLITKEEAHPIVLEHLKKDHSIAAFYFKEGLITKEEARPLLLKYLKTDLSTLPKAHEYLEAEIITKQDITDVLSGHLSTDANDFNHAHTLNLEILQKLRSLAKKSGGNITLDKAPQLKKFFSGKPSLSVADIDKMIAREQQQNKHNAYSFGHWFWGKGNMQNSFKQDQLIIKVSALPNVLQSEIDSKEYLKKFMAYVKKSTENHPSPYGWARVHVKDPGVWIIDEIQSDVVSVARLAFRADTPYDLRDHEAEIKAFASKHFADSMRKLILSAVTERAHKAGINKIEHMSVEFKADQNLSSYRSLGEAKRYTQDQHHQPIKVVDSNGKLVDTTKGNVKDSDIPLPAHYVDTYHEGPQKAGFERDDSTGRWVKFSRRR